MRAASDDPSGLRWLRAAAVCGFAVVWLCSAWVADDAFITFRSVLALFEGFGPRWNVLERVQVYTHPLWYLLLVALRGLGVQSLYAAALALGLGLSSLTVSILLARARSWVGVVAITALLCASKSFVEFSSSGLENPLSHLLVVLLLLLGLGAGPVMAARRGLALGVLLSAIALTRIDLFALVLPLAGWILWDAGPGARRGVVLGLIPLFVWEGWSLLYYGDVVPNTACAKMNHVLPWALRLAQGEAYYSASLQVDPVTLPLIALAVLVGLRCGGAVRFAAVGLLLHFVYVGSIPGDFMAGRMQSAPFVFAVAILATCWSVRRAPLMIVAALALCGALATPRSPLRADRVPDTTFVGRTQLADERAFYADATTLSFGWDGLRPWYSPRGGWTEPGPWRGAPPRIEVAWGGIRTFGAGLGPHFIDEMALSDPLLSRLPLISQGGGWTRPGHLARPLPDAYVESLEAGQNLIADPAVAALWDDVRIATRAPLGDPRRLRAIAGTVLCGRAHRAALLSR